MAENDMNIPTELQFRDVRKQNKVIISKQQRQVLPQNGTNFTMTSTGQQQIIFRLPNDENASIDFNSLWIVANVQIKGLPADISTASANLTNPNLIGTRISSTAADPSVLTITNHNIPILALGDSIESIIARVAVYVNGSELERQDYYNQWESFSNMHTNNSGFANSLGAGAMLMNLDVLEKSRQLLVGSTAPDSNIIQVSFPLRYLGLSNLRSLVPSYLMGGGQSSIEIRIYLTSVTDCLTCGIVNSGTTNATIQPLEKFTPSTTIPTIQLSEVRMNIDYVQTSEDYSSALREYLTGNALTLPLKTYYQTQYQINANAGGWQNYTVSTQFSDIEAVFCVFFNSSEANNIAYLGSDRCHKPKSLIQARLSINGQVYPAVPISFNSGSKSYCGEGYQYLIKALFQNASLEVLGNTNQKYVPINNNTVLLANMLTIPSTTVANTAYINAYANATIAGGVINNPIGNYESKVGSGYFYGVDKRYAKNIAFTEPVNAAGVYTVDNHNLIVEPEIFWESPTQFGIGFDVSKSSYNDEYTLSGADLSKTSGLIQVQLQFDGSDANAYNCLVVVQHKRLLEIGMDNSTIVY